MTKSRSENQHDSVLHHGPRYDHEAHKWVPQCPYGDVCTGCDAAGRCSRVYQSHPRYAAHAGDNTPPYLYAVANAYTDAPSALAFLAWLDEYKAEREAEMWADARAMGVA